MKNVYGTGPLILQMEVDLVVYSDVQEFRFAPGVLFSAAIV